MTQEKKQVVLSGIQPSGQLGIKLLRSIKLLPLQDTHDCIFGCGFTCLTVQQVPAELRRNCLSLLLNILLVGSIPIRVRLSFSLMYHSTRTQLGIEYNDVHG